MIIYVCDLFRFVEGCVHQIYTERNLSQEIYFPTRPGRTHAHPALQLVSSGLQMLIYVFNLLDLLRARVVNPWLRDLLSHTSWTHTCAPSPSISQLWSTNHNLCM
jgi:hypothetical protein